MKRSKFSLSNWKLMSLKMGDLVPCGLLEVLPGDTFQHATQALVRASPLVAPVMHPVHVRIHHWFVPHRLVWDNWENFITGGPDGLNASVFPTKNLNAAATAPKTLADYLGVPAITGAAQPVNAIPFRGYALIYNEWYRDQDLTTALTINTTDGNDGSTPTALQKVAWEKDYYTTARPWTQKGPVVTLPLTGNAPIVGVSARNDGSAATPGAGGVSGIDTKGTVGAYTNAYFSSQANGIMVRSAAGTAGSRPDIYADMSAVSSATINDLRLAMALQRYEEARARYGSRYVEYLRYLGVRSSDARLQRPEYLGGGKQTIQFSEVLQTGVTTAGNTAGVGNLKGHGIGALRSNRYRRFFEEHGYVFSFISIKPITVYNNGLFRTWNRRVKEDFYQRELAHIGQQSILNKEVYINHTTPDGVFGYQDRYDEYRRQESTVAGDFRTTLNYWHMARDFSSDPVLNSSFVVSNPTNRIFADQSGADTMYAMVSHSVQARRLVAGTGASFIF